MIDFFYLFSTALPVSLTALGAGIGQSLITQKALEAVRIQPHANSDIRKISLVGMSLVETSAILGLVVSILLHMAQSPINTAYAAYGTIGVSLAIGISGLVAGLAASYPAQAACLTIARQPFFTNKVLQIMLLTQSVIITPNIFGFLIALFINSRIATVNTFNEALQLLASGFCIGIGSIGPCIGLSIFAYSACAAVGINRKSYQKILPFTFMCEAIIETPAIFSLVIALFILNVEILPTTPVLKGLTFIAAALCMSLSTIATGINTGRTAAAASDHIGENPEIYPLVSKLCLLGLAMIDTFAIYGFIVAILLIIAI